MNENRLMQQIGTIFGAFMTLFYFGVGFYIILSPNVVLSPDPAASKFLRILLGSTFVIYGVYRAYRTYVKVVEIFFTDDDNNKDSF
jgi:threonine/homoserine/homoserine lactone efflux protein